MKSILFISDNYELVSFIMNLPIVEEKGLKFDYKFSAINKNPESLINIGMDPLDVKDPEVIDEIIGRYDLIISAHCKQIFPEKLVSSVRCINIHPGLNPYNRGWFPQVFSIINKKPIGCTIHEMNEKVDHGDIIFQEKVEIFPDDDSLDVYNRVQQVEKRLISQNLKTLIQGNYKSYPMSSEGNYNGIKDFEKLRKLDLGSIATLEEHLDLLRALTHGEYKNAYYEKDGRKYYIKVSIERE